MKILSASQIPFLDKATSAEQHITSFQLMERAAGKVVQWLGQWLNKKDAGKVLVLAGPGNNGGDGLVVARLLHRFGYNVQVALLPADHYSNDRQQALKLFRVGMSAGTLATNNLPKIESGTVVIDALFGTGLTRPLGGLAAAVVNHLNAAQARVIAIDLPSGLFADAPQPTDAPVVRALHTISFGLPKLAFLLPQNAAYVGEWQVEDIGLSQAFINQTETPWHYTEQKDMAGALPKRDKFAYKNTFGHALLMAGSRGKIGAAVLAAGACLRGGVGLLTVRVPGCGYDIIQSTRPEAMCLLDPDSEFISHLPDLTLYQAIGIGPGLGQAEASRAVLEQLLRTAKVPLVIDADALNTLGTHRELLDLLPEGSVLTPHVGEFTRLTEPARDDYHRLELLRDFARHRKCLVVLKGAYTAVADVDGQLYFNSTGNPGMATGGSGDVLTGLLLALRADQRLTPLTVVRLAALAHGRAGDMAAAEVGEAGLVAGDLVRFIGPALREVAG